MCPRIAQWLRRLVVPLLSLPATLLFFLEYLPPLRRADLIWDVAQFHYPLLNYAFKTLRAGRFPEWDPSIYCGVSFAGNIQAGLFYPFTWILFAVNWKRSGLLFTSVEAFAVFHFWLAFVFAWLWLRDRGFRIEAAVCGAASFAFSGFLLYDVQHLGQTAGIAWFPLAFWGLDQAARDRRWRPLWKVALASAMCFLAGMPFLWVVLCFCVVVYAAVLPERRWIVPGGLAALAFSLLIAMVQILPAAEAARMKAFRPSFGFDAPKPQTYFTLLAPNYYNQARDVPPGIDEHYLYLGAAVWLALAWLIRRRGLRAAMPAAVLVALSQLVMFNPFGLLSSALSHLPPLDQMVREWYFIACFPVAGALIAAVALDDFLATRSTRRGWPLLAILAAAIWVVRQLLGRGMLAGWASVWELAATVLCLALVVFALRVEVRPWWRGALIAALFLLIWTDLKVYGTNRRFNATPVDSDRMYQTDVRRGGSDFRGMETAVYRKMLGASAFRLISTENPTAPDVRHYLLATPQGSDPMLPAAFEKEMRGTPLHNDRAFIIDPACTEKLDRLAVRYVVTVRDSESFKALAIHPKFRLLGREPNYFAVYEYVDAQPAYRWRVGEAKLREWSAGRREFAVESVAGGDFVLLEQRYPGWRAYVDGRETQVRPYSQAFQQIRVPAGAHRILFEYRAEGLRPGAAISLASALMLLAIAVPIWPFRP